MGRVQAHLLFLLLLGVPARVAAQTAPVPELPPEEETAPDPEPGRGAEVADPAAVAPVDTTIEAESSRATRWDYSLGVGGGWESNAGAQLLTPGVADYAGYVFGSLARAARRPRSTTSFFLTGAGTLYRDLSDFDRLDGTGGFRGSWNLSRRTTGSLGLGVHYGYSDNSRILSDQGLILPLTRTIDYAGDAGFSQKLSSRTTFRLTARAYRVDFPESELLRDTTSLRLSTGLDRRVGRYDTLSADYSAERVENTQPESELPLYWTHYMYGGWQHALGKWTALRMEGGASYTPEEQTDGSLQPWRFFGGIGLSRAVKATLLSLYYRREVLPVFGVGGLRFTDRVGLNSVTPLGRTFTFSLGGYYTQDAEATAAGERRSSVDGSVTLSARLARWVSLSADGRYYRRWSVGEIPGLENYRVGLFVVFGSAGERPSPYSIRRSNAP